MLIMDQRFTTLPNRFAPNTPMPTLDSEFPGQGLGSLGKAPFQLLGSSDPGILAFIQNARRAGKSDAEIISVLRSDTGGICLGACSDTLINDSFAALDKDTSGMSINTKIALGITGGLVAGGLAGFLIGRAGRR